MAQGERLVMLARRLNAARKALDEVQGSHLNTPQFKVFARAVRALDAAVKKTK